MPFIVASGDTPASKPAPDPYLRAAALHGREPGACVAIEDSKWGIESARTAGLACIGITQTYPRSELSGASHIVDSLDELTPAFFRCTALACTQTHDHATPSARAQPSAGRSIFRRAMSTPGGDLAAAVLTIARIEYPSLDAGRYLGIIERMGEVALARIEAVASAQDAVHILNEYLFDEMGFRGNREHYDDPRNSFLNEVLERRTGIPISLAIVYLEVARRAGLRMDGVNFPGHFLLRVATGIGRRSATTESS